MDSKAKTLSLTLLIAINLFNYIDRQVLAAVEPEIRRELDRGLRTEAAALAVVDPVAAAKIDLSESGAKTRMGLLPMAFLLSYMIFAPLFGWLATRYSRWKLIGIGVIVWSLASGASGLDWHLGPMAAFWGLMATRCFVGIGEGGYGPVAPDMVSDLYPVERRGRAMSFFFLAIPVGGALGYAFGEIIKDRLGWRWAFYLVVPPGVLLGILCFFMRDPRSAASIGATAGPKTGFLMSYLKLFAIPSFTLNTLGMAAMTFTIGGLAFWMPDFLDTAGAQPFMDVGPRTIFGAITAFAGLIATLAGGWAGDALRKRHGGAYFLVSGAAMFLAAPMIVGFIYTPFPFAWIFVFLAVFCLFFNTGPTNTILANVVPSNIRAAGFALNILIIHLLGDASSPSIVGALAGGDTPNLGFLLLAFVVLIGGVFWIWGSVHLERDTKLAVGG